MCGSYIGHEVYMFVSEGNTNTIRRLTDAQHVASHQPRGGGASVFVVGQDPMRHFFLSEAL